MRRWLLAIVLGLLTAGVALNVVKAEDRDVEVTSEDPDRAPDVGIERFMHLVGDRHARIGVSIADVDPGGQMRGARVDRVEEESPAAKAGIRNGDVITDFDGERVRSARQLSRIVSETPAGRSVPVAVLREGRRMELDVTPEGREPAFSALDPAGPGGPAAPALPHFRFERPDRGSWFERFHREMDEHGAWGPGSRGRLGVTAQPMSAQLAEHFGAAAGVLVSTVRQESPAARAGVKAGDVITAVNGTKVDSPAELVRAIAGAEGGAELTLSLVRERKAMNLKVTIPKRERPAERTRPV
jgi:serine protease Do